MLHRNKLPNRREQTTLTVDWEGNVWQVSVGFDLDGNPFEVFAKGMKTGSALDALVDDACVLISLLLQYGVKPDQLGYHFGREGVDPFAKAASPIGFIAQIIEKVASDARSTEMPDL